MEAEPFGTLVSFGDLCGIAFHGRDIAVTEVHMGGPPQWGPFLGPRRSSFMPHPWAPKPKTLNPTRTTKVGTGGHRPPPSRWPLAGEKGFSEEKEA